MLHSRYTEQGKGYQCRFLLSMVSPIYEPAIYCKIQCVQLAYIYVTAFCFLCFIIYWFPLHGLRFPHPTTVPYMDENTISVACGSCPSPKTIWATIKISGSPWCHSYTGQRINTELLVHGNRSDPQSEVKGRGLH